MQRVHRSKCESLLLNSRRYRIAMPFVQRIVQPIRLGREPVEEENKFDLDIISNRKLINVLRQIGSLASRADEIVAGISSECEEVVHRTNRLVARIRHTEQLTKQLDAKAVTVRK